MNRAPPPTYPLGGALVLASSVVRQRRQQAARVHRARERALVHKLRDGVKGWGSMFLNET